jgi:Flp pilus assembly pilin Flp
MAFRRHRHAAEDVLVEASEALPVACDEIRVNVSRAADHALTLARPDVALVTSIATIFTSVAMVFPQVSSILAGVPAILTAIAPAPDVPRVTDVFAHVAAVLAHIATIFTAVEAVLDPIAPLLARRLGQCD